MVVGQHYSWDHGDEMTDVAAAAAAAEDSPAVDHHKHQVPFLACCYMLQCWNPRHIGHDNRLAVEGESETGDPHLLWLAAVVVVSDSAPWDSSDEAVHFAGGHAAAGARAVLSLPPRPFGARNLMHYPVTHMRGIQMAPPQPPVVAAWNVDGGVFDVELLHGGGAAAAVAVAGIPVAVVAVEEPGWLGPGPGPAEGARSRHLM